MIFAPTRKMQWKFARKIKNQNRNREIEMELISLENWSEMLNILVNRIKQLIAEIVYKQLTISSLFY